MLSPIIAAGGRVLAASEGFEALTPFRPAIDTLIAAARPTLERPVSRWQSGSQARDAEAVRFRADDRDCFLVVVGPAQAKAVQAEPLPEPES